MKKIFKKILMILLCNLLLVQLTAIGTLYNDVQAVEIVEETENIETETETEEVDLQTDSNDEQSESATENEEENKKSDDVETEAVEKEESQPTDNRAATEDDKVVENTDDKKDSETEVLNETDEKTEVIDKAEKESEVETKSIDKKDEVEKKEESEEEAPDLEDSIDSELEEEEIPENVLGSSYASTYFDGHAEVIDFKKVFDFTNAGRWERNPNELMAHNIYSDPNLSNMSGQYSGFLIDFKADYRAKGTYWALCNWSMDLSNLARSYTITDEGGAYAGLQSRGDGTKAIMSFWEINYRTSTGRNVTITPRLVYPTPDGEGYFDNEGSGSQFITSFTWEEGNWYRMYLNSYDDSATGNTFVEMWIYDFTNKKWTKICCYDTKLKNSYLKGDMSQFMENYDYTYCNNARSFQYANIYLRDKNTNEWKPVTSSKLSIDTWWGNKKGSYKFGSTGNALWGITCGYGADTAPLNADISSWEYISCSDGVGLPGNTIVAGWKQSGNKWWYQNADGTYPKSEWKSIQGKWFYFDANGYMCTGWLYKEGKWFFLDTNGCMQTGWVCDGGKWYYLDANGVMATNRWIADTYYVKSNGVMAVNEWIYDKYYVGADGKWVPGKQRIVAGWKQDKTGWWYQNADGTYPKSCWKIIGGKYYYFNASGYMQTGWIYYNSYWFYLESSGAMATNKWIEGKYFVKANGAMAVSEWVDGGKYYVDGNGVWVPGKTR